MAKPDDSKKDCTTFDAMFQPLERPLAQHEQNHPHHSVWTCVNQRRRPPFSLQAETGISSERLAGIRGNTFLATVGEKLHCYWKINKHWLVALRNYLARPFDQQVVMTLDKL